MSSLAARRRLGRAAPPPVPLTGHEALAAGRRLGLGDKAKDARAIDPEAALAGTRAHGYTSRAWWIRLPGEGSAPRSLAGRVASGGASRWS